MNYGREEKKPILVSVHHKNTRRILTLKVSKPVTLGVHQEKQTSKSKTHPPTKKPKAADRENSHTGTLWRQLSLPQRTFLYWSNVKRSHGKVLRERQKLLGLHLLSSLERQQRLSHATPTLPASQITLWETSILLNSRQSRWLGKLGLIQMDPKPNWTEPRLCIWTHYR